jgi:hypothetical protein
MCISMSRQRGNYGGGGWQSYRRSSAPVENPVEPSASFKPLSFERELDAFSRYRIERTALQREVEEWLTASDTRSFMLLAPTGCGKSVFAAQLVQTLPGVVAFHFCTPNRRTLAAQTWIRSLAAKLATQLDDYAQALANTIKPHQWIQASVSVTEAQSNAVVSAVTVENLVVLGTIDEFDTLLRKPLEHVKDPGNPRVIIVDGLDEAATIDGLHNIPWFLQELEELPQWLRFVWTSRSDRRVLRYINERCTRIRYLSNADNQDDVRRYIERRGFMEQAFVAAAAEKADGNFQYAKVLLDAIESGQASANEIPSLPPGLPAIYGELLRRRIEPGLWSSAFFGIASSLAAALEPLSEEQVSRFSSIATDTVRDRLGVFGQFLKTYTDVDDTLKYTIDHPSLRDYFFDHDRNHDFWISPPDAHARIAASYAACQGDAWRSCDGYGLRYLTTHLANARRDDDLRNLLLDFNYLQSKLNATQPNALIADYDYLPWDADLRRIQSAIRLSAHVIARDPRQFASQLVGRLLPYEIPLAAASEAGTSTARYRASSNPPRPRRPGQRRGRDGRRPAGGVRLC